MLLVCECLFYKKYNIQKPTLCLSPERNYPGTKLNFYLYRRCSCGLGEKQVQLLLLKPQARTGAGYPFVESRLCCCNCHEWRWKCLGLSSSPGVLLLPATDGSYSAKTHSSLAPSALITYAVSSLLLSRVPCSTVSAYIFGTSERRGATMWSHHEAKVKAEFVSSPHGPLLHVRNKPSEPSDQWCGKPVKLELTFA